MPSTYWDKIRLLCGDLDGQDGSFIFTEEQVASLIEDRVYLDAEGDRKVNLLEVSMDYLDIMAAYHPDTQTERTRTALRLRDRLAQRLQVDAARFVVDPAAAGAELAPTSALTAHGNDPTAHHVPPVPDITLANLTTHIAQANAHHTPPVADVTQAILAAAVTTHDTATVSHGSIRTKAEATETSLETHIAQHPGGVGGVPADNTISRAKLTATLLADVDAHADQTDLDAHEASTHNVDATARSEALAAQALVTGHQSAASPHNAAIALLIEAHRAVATAHQQPGGGGGGVSEARVQELINATALSALQGFVTDGQIPAAIMRDAEFTAATVRTLLSLTATEANDVLVGATISGQILSFTQNDGSTVNITIPTATPGTGDGVVQQGAFNADQTELVLTLDSGGTVTIDVPAALRGGSGITAAAIAALAPGATNSNTEIPSAHNGVVGKISIANIHAYMASSVGLGPRINPGPSVGNAGKLAVINAAGNAYELAETVAVIAGPVTPVAALEGMLQWNPANDRVEICENNGHLVTATEGTWDYTPIRNDLYIEESLAFISGQSVGDYAYDAGAGHFYFWAVVGVENGNQVLGWRQVNPSTALALSRRTTGIVVYWLGDQASDAAALAALGSQYRNYVFAERDAFYLAGDTIRRLETFTAAGTYVDNFEWLPTQLPVPSPSGKRGIPDIP